MILPNFNFFMKFFGKITFTLRIVFFFTSIDFLIKDLLNFTIFDYWNCNATIVKTINKYIFSILVCWNPTTALNVARQEYIAGASPPGTPNPGVEWQIKCQTGYLWPDGSLVKTINCSGTNWSAIPETCQGYFLT